MPCNKTAVLTAQVNDDLSLALKDESVLRQALCDVLGTDSFSLRYHPSYLQINLSNLHITFTFQPRSEIRIVASRPLVLTPEQMEKVKSLALEALRVASVRYAQGQLIQAAIARGARPVGHDAVKVGRKIVWEL